MSNSLSRRSFVRGWGAFGLGIGATALGTGDVWAEEKKKAHTNIRNFKESMSYREIGSTGVQVSSFSMGTGSCNAEILHKALNMGVNLIHTSTAYSGGKSIRTVGDVIKGKNDRVHIALKDNFSSLEETLKILGVKSVDFTMFNRHNAE
ncbi:MAG: hypothetical protein GF401_19125, partial [Chitinivibrionales bacterium]|nr:hypothetical protein [Chitinivibrionales bacterium]